MIPNPKKTVEIAYSMDEIKAALDRVLAYSGSKYRMTNANRAMEIYTFSVLEFLSVGALVDVGLVPRGDKTEVNIEVRRAVGSFDQAHEVSSANSHIEYMLNALGALLLNGRDPKAHPIETPQPAQANSTQTKIAVFIIVAAMLGFIAYACVRMFWH